MNGCKWLLIACFSWFFFSFANNSLALPNVSPNDDIETAIFAGGCFWSLQADFDKVPGVVKTAVGYTGGELINPTYKEVLNGGTGHYEAVQITFDPTRVSYPQLLDFFWHHIDPTNENGQFCDVGEQYRTVIFYNDETQKKLAEKSKAELIQSSQLVDVATLILPAQTFYPAEDYHQKYYQKNRLSYRYYRFRCGREKRLHALWEAKK